MIARVFAPYRTQAGLHGVAGRAAGQAHAVAFSEAVPMRSVFGWAVEQRAPAARDQTASQICRAHGANDGPFESCSVGNGWQGRLRQGRAGRK